MNHRFLLCITGVLVLSHTLWASPMILRVNVGKALVWKTGSDGWTGVTDSSALSFGDSVFVDNGEEAVIAIGNDITLMFKDMGRIALDGDAENCSVALIQGQLFLKRTQPYEMTFFTATARGCTFIPVGTAGAVKFTRKGEPTVAMLEGRMRVEAPSGDAVMVGPGQFATFGINNTFSQGDLPPAAITALEQWTGVALEAPAQTAQAAEPEIVQDTPEPAIATPAPEAVEPAQPQEPAAVTPAETVTEAPAQETAAQPASVEDVPAQETDAVGEKEAAKKEEKKSRKKSKASERSEAAVAPGGAVESPESGQAPEEGDAPDDDAAEEEVADGKEEEEKPREKPVWGLSAGPVTVGDEQWTRIAFFGDIPIWRFGLGIDVEVFMNADGQFDKKGWDFTEENWLESVTRKLVYIRFQHENDPVFVKFGGLSSVTLGYGFVMDRFTNMLHYPDEKQLGLQFYLNDLGPVGVSLQSILADFHDLRRGGGIFGGRFALKPMKFTEKPVIGGLELAATYVRDMNQYSYATMWRYEGNLKDKNENNLIDWNFANKIIDEATIDSFSNKNFPEDVAIFDSVGTVYGTIDTTYKDSSNAISMFGADISIPLIQKKVLKLVLYGQFGMTLDDKDGDKAEGWGIGAPGVSLAVGPFWSQIEYRHTRGLFTPGYFGCYYFDERLIRYPLSIKEDRLVDEQYNGVYGNLGMNIKNLFIVSGRYQYLVPRSSRNNPDHRFEITGAIGTVIIEKVPKLNRAETFLHKTAIGSNDDAFFEKTVTMYWGFRLGFEIVKGAGLLWESRYGWKYDDNGNLVNNDNISIQAFLTF